MARRRATSHINGTMRCGRRARNFVHLVGFRPEEKAAPLPDEETKADVLIHPLEFG